MAETEAGIVSLSLSLSLSLLPPHEGLNVDPEYLVPEAVGMYRFERKKAVA